MIRRLYDWMMRWPGTQGPARAGWRSSRSSKARSSSCPPTCMLMPMILSRPPRPGSLCHDLHRRLRPGGHRRLHARRYYLFDTVGRADPQVLRQARRVRGDSGPARGVETTWFCSSPRAVRPCRLQGADHRCGRRQDEPRLFILASIVARGHALLPGVRRCSTGSASRSTTSSRSGSSLVTARGLRHRCSVAAGVRRHQVRAV